MSSKRAPIVVTPPHMVGTSSDTAGRRDQAEITRAHVPGTRDLVVGTRSHVEGKRADVVRTLPHVVGTLPHLAGTKSRSTISEIRPTLPFWWVLQWALCC